MAKQLRGQLLERVPCAEGRLAEITIVDPDNYEYWIRCHMIRGGRDVGGVTNISGSVEYSGSDKGLAFLIARYGEDEVRLLAEGIVLGLDTWSLVREGYLR